MRTQRSLATIFFASAFASGSCAGPREHDAASETRAPADRRSVLSLEPADIAWPDPGWGDQSTDVRGPDIDDNGVRDDVQAWVGATFPDSERARVAIFRYAVILRQFLALANDKQASVDNARDIDRAIGCIFYVHPLAAGDTARNALARMVNTRVRIVAFLCANAQLQGEYFTGQRPNEKGLDCDFDPATMKN